MNDEGYVGPFRLLSADAAREAAARLRVGEPPSTWLKGAAASSSEIYELATRSELLDRVETMIGPDILLCGANLVERDPGQRHPWHVDVHFAGPGRAASVWLALDGVDDDTTLCVIPGSQRYGATPQALSSAAAATTSVDGQHAVRLAGAIDPEARLVALPMSDGDAVLFDAALWHGTRNDASHVRSALVLHYAAPEVPIRIHGSGLEWPTEYVDDPLPPCHLVRGDDPGRSNRVAAAPSGAVRLNRVHQPDTGLLDSPTDWKPDPLVVGPTTTLGHLMVKRHAVRSASDEHGAHAHAYDQIIVTHGGSGTLAVGGDGSGLGAALGPATVAFLPAGTMHTAWNNGGAPHLHIDVSFIGSLAARPAPMEPLGASVIDVTTVDPDEIDLDERGRSSVTILDGASVTADQVTVRRVDLAPGFRGASDVDDHDVVLIVHSGCLRTLGHEVGAGGVVIYGAGEEHRLESAGDAPVLLTVIELRGGGTRSTRRPDRRAVPSMGTSELRRRLVRRLPRGVRSAVRRWRRVLRSRAGR